MSFITIGNCSKYYSYILIVFICQLICDYFTVYNKDNDDDDSVGKNILIYYDYKLENHFLIQNLLDYLSQIFCGIILYYFYSKTEKNKDGEMSLIELKIKQTEYLGGKIESIKFDLFLIGIIYSANLLIRTFLISLKFDAGFWTLEILIIIFFCRKILKVNFGKHQKVTVFLLSGIGLIFQIISFFLPRTNHDCKTEDCKDKYIYDNNLFILMYKKFKYGFLIPIIIIVYFIDFAMRDYGWVKSKYLMDTLAVPPFQIIFSIGICGTILAIIILIFTSSFSCKTYNDVIFENDEYKVDKKIIDFSRQICNLYKFDESKKQLKFYYDNFLIFLSDYKENPLQIFSLIIYFFMCGIINFCHILMLKNLDSIIVLVNINFNYFLARMIDFVIKKGNKKYMTASLFIILELVELIAIFAYLIYMEIIELKFWNLDHDLKRNIDERSKFEYEISLVPHIDEEKKDTKEENGNENEENN